MESCHRRIFSKVKPVRELDVFYDKILSLPLDRDYNREIVKARSATLSYVVQPYFDTMFSDCRTPYKLVARQSYDLPPTSDVISAQREPGPSVDLKKVVAGAHRSAYFRQPVKKSKQPGTQVETIMSVERSIEGGIAPEKLVAVLPPQHKMTQSDYRESETQTDPWTHDVIATGKVRLLDLGWLKVDPYNILSQADIALLERHWHKQAWDELMPRFSLLTKSERRIITEGLAANDTAARDVVLEKENKIRIGLSAQRMSGRSQENSRELVLRLQRFQDYLAINRMSVVRYLRRNLQRGFRRLTSSYKEKVHEGRFSGSPKFKSKELMYSSEKDKPPKQLDATDSFHQVKELDMIERLTMSSKYLVDSKLSSYQDSRKSSCQRSKKREERRIEKSVEEALSATRTMRHRRRDVHVQTPGVEEVYSDWGTEDMTHSSILQRCIRMRGSEINQETKLPNSMERQENEAL